MASGAGVGSKECAALIGLLLSEESGFNGMLGEER